MAQDIEDIISVVRNKLQDAQDALSDALDKALDEAANTSLADVVDEVLGNLIDDVECPSDKADEHADGLIGTDDDGNEIIADEENPDDPRATLIAVFTAGWDAAMALITERVESAQYRG